MGEALYELVPTTLSDEQLAEMRDALASKKIAQKEIKEEKRKAVSDFNARISALDSEMQDIATKITNRTVDVQVEITEVANDADYTVSLVSKSAGKLIRTRDMSVEERLAADKRKLQLVLPLGEVKELKKEAEASPDPSAGGPKMGPVHEPTDGQCCASAEDHRWTLVEPRPDGPAEGDNVEPYTLGMERWFQCDSLGCKAWAEGEPVGLPKEEQTVTFVPGEETTELNGQKLVKVERVPTVPNDTPTEEDPEDPEEASPEASEDTSLGADEDDEENEEVDDEDDEDDDTDTPPAEDLF